MYKYYSISRGKFAESKSHVCDCTTNGKIIEGTSQHIDTQIAKKAIMDAIETGMTIMKLPISAESDYFNEFIVMDNFDVDDSDTEDCEEIINIENMFK